MSAFHVLAKGVYERDEFASRLRFEAAGVSCLNSYASFLAALQTELRQAGVSGAVVCYNVVKCASRDEYHGLVRLLDDHRPSECNDVVHPPWDTSHVRQRRLAPPAHVSVHVVVDQAAKANMDRARA